MATKNLSWQELACKDGTPYPRHLAGQAKILGHEFEELRQRLGGQPLTVLSAYRTPEHNARVGGAKNSQHCLGKALDIRTPRGWSPPKMAAIVKQMVNEGSKIRGLGIYPWGIHIDIRTADSLVVWSSALEKES